MHNWGNRMRFVCVSYMCVCVRVCDCRESCMRVVEPNPKCIDLDEKFIELA